jgi:hypothetical protein
MICLWPVLAPDWSRATMLLRDLIPALKPEVDLVKTTDGTIDDYEKTAQVLLMCGTEAAPPSKTPWTPSRMRCRGRLVSNLPAVIHGAAQDQGRQAIGDRRPAAAVLWRRYDTPPLTTICCLLR